MRGMAREYAAGNSLGPGWRESAGIFGCPVGGSVADRRRLGRLLGIPEDRWDQELPYGKKDPHGFSSPPENGDPGGGNPVKPRRPNGPNPAPCLSELSEKDLERLQVDLAAQMPELKEPQRAKGSAGELPKLEGIEINKERVSELERKLLAKERRLSEETANQAERERRAADSRLVGRQGVGSKPKASSRATKTGPKRRPKNLHPSPRPAGRFRTPSAEDAFEAESKLPGIRKMG